MRNPTLSRRLGIAAGAALAVATSLGVASPAQASVSSSVQNGTLTITGDADDDLLTLRLAPTDPNRLQLDIGDNGSANQTFDRGSFTSIELRGGGGNDRLRIDQVNGAFADEAMTFVGGRGNDTMLGGDGVERFLGGRGRDAVDGNVGNDVALLGSGDDSFTWDPGDGSDVVEGQAGQRDVMVFNGSNSDELMDLSANGQRVRFFRNLGNITMDTDGVERLALATLGGADTFTVNDLSGTDMVRADVDLAAATGGGDGAVDSVVANGTATADSIELSARLGRVQVDGLPAHLRIVGSEVDDDRLAVNGLAGTDDVSIGNGVDDLIGVDVDLGADQ